ncbi:DinB family protein [Dietzia lutea]|uniref:Serine/arginine repetitive matrix protein 1 n=1 Tax=Dietzia lutea TaxID=546160 RepID=A0A2S1R929_9ACTN|nr:DinB family protein [Dietzia lutea]AWH92783.1 serine/arginine repetitive matrix protein 1 [Dietzia lutea]
MTATHTLDWTGQLVDQMDHHWTSQLRPRLEGMTDAEYHFSPAPDERTWDVRPRGTSRAPMQGGVGDHTIDFAYPEPVPAPLTTIAWRIGHVVVAALGARWHSHFGGPPHDYMTHTYAGDAAGALAQLDRVYAGWMDGVRGLDAEALARPAGEAEGPWAQYPMAALVLHINREVIHHGAEMCLLRDVYATTH